MVTKQDIKNMVQPGMTVKFMFYRNGELWYQTACGFDFPVPTADCGDAVFLKEDKALLFMRYIRKHIENIEEAKAEVL